MDKKGSFSENSVTVALAGSPNVGKSTVFNNLTGLRRHTGNWCGKTVDVGGGVYKFNGKDYEIFDLPGTYSLYAHSAEEVVARDFVCFNDYDAIVVVCDGSSLARSLGLVLQIIELSTKVVLCVNLLDEAKRKHVEIDLNKLSELLGICVVGTVAHNKKSLENLKEQVERVCIQERLRTPIEMKYDENIEKAVFEISRAFKNVNKSEQYCRWASLRLLEGGDSVFTNRILDEISNQAEETGKQILNIVNDEKKRLLDEGINEEMLSDSIAGAIANKANIISSACSEKADDVSCSFDKKMDRIFTGKIFAFPIMLVMLLLIFWITITGANYPSQLLSNFFTSLENPIYDGLLYLHIPTFFAKMLTFGMYRVLTWVVAVMLPPMAIFFPLFTILEDLGYLPRIAFNLDRPFKACNACGKQALTMCMGFGCNAVGVTGCRIIDSKRERLLAIITNSFVPCNGRFPTIIALLSMFFVTGAFFGTFQTLLLMLVIVLSVVMTLVVTYILSKTLLKGQPSSFTLELPPYRKPQFAKVIVRSMLDRTLFVLSRAVSVAAPAGIVIFLLSNIHVSNVTLLSHMASFLDPFGRLLGLDGIIILAFILGFPANEIVVPIMIMGYMATSELLPVGDLSALYTLLSSNGWTCVTAICMIVFCLFHWPCSTTLITVYKETKSLKWTIASFFVPTITGALLCSAINLLSKLFA